MRWDRFAVGPDHHIHPVLGSYAETRWLPIIGPSCYVIGRYMAQADTPFDMDPADLAPAFGLNAARLVAAVERLAFYRLASTSDTGATFHARWPDLTPKQVRKLERPVRA